MQQNKLNTIAMSITNLKAKPARTFCLAIVSAILAFTVFGGSIFTMNLHEGLNLISKRFGADLMVVPQNTAQKAQAAILNGETGYFYFDAGIVGEIERIEGVACASPQFFLTSLSDACCSAPVQLIAYDPQTDFVVKPWISEKHYETVKDGQLVIGSKIYMNDNKTIKLYNHEYSVAARLSPSASGFDTSIFMTMNTMRQLIDTAHKEKYNFLADYYGSNAISAVLIKADTQKNSSKIASDLRKNIEGIDVLESQGIFSHISQAISGLNNYIIGFLFLIWFLSIIVLAAIFSGIIHERKKEFAVLRTLGATRKKLISVVLCEAGTSAFVGSIAGIIFASFIVFSFSALIGKKLALPYINISFCFTLLLFIAGLALTVLTASFSSLYCALKISKAETYFTMREGE